MPNNISGGVVHQVPDDLKAALISDSKANTLWESLTPLARNEWICWVEYVKKEETRKEHVARTVSELKDGMRRPCCWLGCIHRTDKKISPSVQGILNKKKGCKQDMKVININKVKKNVMGPPLFTGNIKSQTPVTDKEGADISINYIHFPKGVRNKFHKHSNDQILIVTKGKGIVATRNKKVKVKEGDVIWAPKGEEHWHGAESGSEFSHISVTRAGTKLTQLEK